MAQQSTLLEDGFDRIQTAFKSVEDEVQKVQKRFETESNKLSKSANKRIKNIRKEMLKYPAVKQADSLRQDLSKQFQSRAKEFEKQVEGGIETVLGGLQIASQSEIDKLDKKLGRINRRLKALDKTISEATARQTPPSSPGATS